MNRTPQGKKNRKEEGRVNQGFRVEAEGKSQEYQAPPISVVRCEDVNRDNLSASSLRLEETFQEEPLSQRRSPDGCEGKTSVEEIAVSRESDSPPLKSFNECVSYSPSKTTTTQALPKAVNSPAVPLSPDTSLSYTLPGLPAESIDEQRFTANFASPIEYSNSTIVNRSSYASDNLSDVSSQTDVPLPFIADYVHFDVVDSPDENDQTNATMEKVNESSKKDVKDYNVFDVQMALDQSINRAMEIRKMKLNDEKSEDENIVKCDNTNKPADGGNFAHFLDHNVEFIEENWEDSFWEDDEEEEVIEKSKKTPRLPIVPQGEEDISKIVCEAVDILWSFRRCGMDFDEAVASDKYLLDDSFRLFIFDLCREILTDLYFEEDNALPCYQRRPCSLSKRNPPTQLTLVRPIVVEKVLNLLNTQKCIEESALKNRRLDNVDALLSTELVEEESDWINYDKDECQVKLQVADQLFELLLKDSIRL